MQNNNSKIISLLVLILLVVGGFLLLKNSSPLGPVATEPSNTSPAIVSDGQYCFMYSHQATEDEPYAVEEHVLIYMWDNINVIGRKMGTQNGPDMTNGYTGLLSGKRDGNNMELLHSYTIEGSTNKELEIYTIQNGSLLKKRWVLVEKDGILVPDKIGEPKIITYTSEKCPE